jgi:pSer/pThr/pTyr-binding forkhead associated (FHA) protein
MPTPTPTNSDTASDLSLTAALYEHTLVITDECGTRKLILRASQYTLGRDRDNDIRLHSEFVSRHHAILVKIQKPDGEIGYCIMDGDRTGKPSKNGITIDNRHKVSIHDLDSGDIVTFAPQVHFLYLAPRAR